MITLRGRRILATLATAAATMAAAGCLPLEDGTGGSNGGGGEPPPPPVVEESLPFITWYIVTCRPPCETMDDWTAREVAGKVTGITVDGSNVTWEEAADDPNPEGHVQPGGLADLFSAPTPIRHKTRIRPGAATLQLNVVAPWTPGDETLMCWAEDEDGNEIPGSRDTASAGISPDARVILEVTCYWNAAQ